MSKKNRTTGDDFRTTHNLKFIKADESPFPGFAAFSLGGVAGFFSVPELTVDFMVAEMDRPDHMVDVVEWFSEMAVQLGYIGVRVMACKDAELRAFLIQHHGFKPIHTGTLFKQITGEN